MSSLGDFLDDLPVPVNAGVSLALLAAVWKLDRLTGTQVSMSLFYLIPIAYSARYIGGGSAYAVALLSASAWLESDLMVAHRYSHWIIPYWNAGVRLGFFVIVVSLSRLIVRLRRLNQLEREAKETADAASEMKSAMLSFVSHEIGNALTVLKMSLYSLQDSEPSPANEDRAEYYAIAKKVVVHLTGAAANFLNAHRLETGGYQPHIQKTLVRAVVLDTVEMLKPQCEKKGLRLTLDIPDVPVPVRADPEALALILSNLIGNAFKYTPDGGSVSVRAAVTGAAASTVRIDVEDSGIGISPEDRERIFSGFFRTEAGRKVEKGFGVGLKVAHDLLESMGASLDLDSAPGRGSRFSFELPLWDKGGASRPA